jgi:hypothetical protein
VTWPAEDARVTIEYQASLLAGADAPEDALNHLLVGLPPKFSVAIAIGQRLCAGLQIRNDLQRDWIVGEVKDLV